MTPCREDCTRPGVPLVLLHHFEGPVLWPLSRIAMLREEWDGRLEATSAGGEVAHRPGPLDPFRTAPLHEVAPGTLVHPGHVRRQGGALHVPGGWRLGDAELPGPPPEAQPSPDVRLAAVQRQGGFAWLTPEGEEPGPATRAEALREQPDLVRAGPHMVRPGAVRGFVRRGKRVRVFLEGGHEVEAEVRSLAGLAKAVGLEWPDPLDGVPPSHRRAYQCRLRDWPAPLLHLPPEELRRRCEDDPVQLIYDVIWEAGRTRLPGRATTPRGLFYNPLRVLAQRLGILGREASRVLGRRTGLPGDLLRLLGASLPRPALSVRAPSRGAWTDDGLWHELELRLDEFVGEWRLLTYRGLGFVDKGGPNRVIGDVRPTVVLLVEKSSLEQDARLVADMFGVSLLVLGGVPTWIATEFFAEHLRTRTSGPVLLVSFCDHDPYGWSFPASFAAQLERYSVATDGILRLVKPSCFTPEELDLLALDLDVSPNERKLVEDWVRESGGVNGKARGLYADFLPLERLIEAFRSSARSSEHGNSNSANSPERSASRTSCRAV